MTAVNVFLENIFTIPNQLFFSRLFYDPRGLSGSILDQEYRISTALIPEYSGFTAVISGWIVRRLNTLSNLGKPLYPPADKLMQIAIDAFPVICLKWQIQLVKPLLFAKVFIRPY